MATPTNNLISVTANNDWLNKPLNSPNYNMGTINIGNNPTPITPTLKAFNESMVNGTPTVLSNQTVKKQIPEIIDKSKSLGIQFTNPIQSQVPQNTQQIKDFTNAPYSTRDGQNYFYNEQTQAYDIPDVGSNTGLFAQDPYSLAMAKNIEDARKKNDQALASALEGIKNRFEQYRTTQRNVTESGAAGARNALLQSEGGSRGSVSQFASATSDARVESIMKDGQQALQELDNKEKELISATQSAYAQDDFKYVSQLNAQIEKLRQEKLATSTAINEQLAQEAATARANQIQGERDNLIANIFSQGVTDPAQILLEANKAGYNFTAKEINETLQNISANFGLDNVKGLSQEVQEFYRLKNTQGGLSANILSLPSESEQIQAYIRGKTNAETRLKTVTNGGSPTITTSGGQTIVRQPIQTSGGEFMDYTDPKYTISVIRNSKGGKDLTGEQSKPISKALTAINQVDDLARSLVGEKTGPILGVIRSNNPYDVKAQIIKGQLQSIIPNLARGVYGEVGVLTDQDIINYSKTLATLDSQEAVNNALIAMTQKAAFNSIKNNLEVLAASRRDVSLFEPIYLSVEKNIESKIPKPTTYQANDAVYSVQTGDTFYKLAQRYGTTVDALKAINPKVDMNNLRIGQTLNLPIAGVQGSGGVYNGVSIPGASVNNAYEGITLPN